jgi:hypothetical protein
MDEFEGMAAVDVKMNSEIEKTLLPLAPQIISLSKGVSTNRSQPFGGLYFYLLYSCSHG